jgi:hypothetical protein
MKTQIFGANIGYAYKRKHLEIPAVENQELKHLIEKPVMVVENHPKVEPVVEETKLSDNNEGGTGEGEIINHAVEGGWKAKRDKKKTIQEKPAE